MAIVNNGKNKSRTWTAMKDNGKKIRILRLWELLKSETDENNPMDSVTIINRLKSEGLIVERKTLYDDVKLLNDNGFEVLCIRSRQNMYYVADRSFDDAEIRMLTDAVFSANFITTKKSEVLADKLAHLASKSSYSSLMNTNSTIKDKHGNEQIWYTVDKINCALQQGKKIKFRYFDYNYRVERVYRKHGGFYVVNPVGLIFNEGNYYFVGFGDKYKQVANYRIDRMDNADVTLTDSIRPEWIKDFDLIKHQNESFSMFLGRTVSVQLLADNSLTDVMLDRFGYDIRATRYDENRFFFRAKVQVSPMFFQWLVTFGDKIKIIEPFNVRDEYVNFLKNIVESYSKK